MELILLGVLILLNGAFAMSEIAVVSSRKARLQRLVDDGMPGAGMAMTLHEAPSNFLSTIQVGITSVGILSGAIGEAALADPLQAWIAQAPLLARVQAQLVGPQAGGSLSAELQPRIETDGGLHRVLLGALPEREAAATLAARVATLLGGDIVTYVVLR